MHESGLDGRGPEAVAGSGEADTDVGREDARVQTDDEHTHVGPDRVGQHVRARRLDVDPLLAVVAAASDLEAGALDQLAELAGREVREQTTAERIVGRPPAPGRT